jgi:uncharacterized protein (TIGR03382 family)
VAQAPSTLAVTAGPSPANRGSPVTVAATVSTVGAAPAGSVTFTDGTASLGTVVLDATGHASLVIDTLVVGQHALAARWPGDGNHLGASGQATVTVVVPTSLQVTVTSSRSPSRTGRPVTLTATVTGPAATPTGAVTFRDGGAPLGTVSLVNGRASIQTRTLAKGTHVITVDLPVDTAVVVGTLAGGEVVENTSPVALAGTALHLGGSSEPASAALAIVDASGGALDTPEGTVEAWARAGWTSADAVGAAPEVASLGGAGGVRWSLVAAPDRAHLVVTVGSTQASLPAALGDGAWHHLALVSQRGATTLLVDGVQVGQVAGGLGTAASATLSLGNGFVGWLDEVRIWSVARGVADLVANANQPLVGDEAGLRGLWRLDEGVGLELFDATASHLDGAVTLVTPDSVQPAAFTASDAWSTRRTRSGVTLDAGTVGYDADGDPLTLTETQLPAHGDLTASGQRLGYRSDQGWSGTDAVDFTLSDGTNQSSGTLTIVVDPALTCRVDLDCGGGQVCASGLCQSAAITHLAGGCGCAGVGGAAISPWVLAMLLGLAWRRGRGASPGKGR